MITEKHNLFVSFLSPVAAFLLSLFLLSFGFSFFYFDDVCCFKKTVH